MGLQLKIETETKPIISLTNVSLSNPFQVHRICHLIGILIYLCFIHWNYLTQFQWPTMLVFAPLDHSLYPKPIQSNIKFFIDHPFAMHMFIWSLVLGAAHMWMSFFSVQIQVIPIVSKYVIAIPHSA